ncbi:hypothetical protein ACNF40_07750 [Cuniculiplasma sp. SKW4]|uniref:hypothetical protein n=1 Tax=Cuniculiplasma sp. SKW4 TaxID=3400171 RepID=UPI003FD408A2
MADVIVEHKWKEKNGEEVVKVVGSIIDMQKNGKLPAGFTLKSISVLKGENTAICNWEAPSVKDMKDLLEKVNPPTKHEVLEAQKMF